MGCKFSKATTVNAAYVPVNMSQFKIIKIIGKGTFGKVCFVEFISEQKHYALKYTFKDQAIHDKAVHHIIQERRILEEISHPFICMLKFSFQDDSIMYMALDYMPGGDLRFHMKNRKWTEVHLYIL